MANQCGAAYVVFAGGSKMSDEELIALREEAIEAKRKLYLARYIPSAKQDLCWLGRIARGNELALEAQVKGDKERVKEIMQGIRQIERLMDADRNAWLAAEQAYRAAGGSEPIVVGDCTCNYCAAVDAPTEHYLAESRLRRAVFALTEPETGGLPAPLQLIDAADEKKLDLFNELAQAQQAYYYACLRRKIFPEWGVVIHGW